MGIVMTLIGLSLFIITLYNFIITFTDSILVILTILIIGIISLYGGYEFMSKQKLFISERGIVFQRKNRTEFSCKWDQISNIRIYKGEYDYHYYIKINLKDNDFFYLINYFGWTKKIMKRISQELIIYQKRHEFVLFDELHWAKK